MIILFTCNCGCMHIYMHSARGTPIAKLEISDAITRCSPDAPACSPAAQRQRRSARAALQLIMICSSSVIARGSNIDLQMYAWNVRMKQ